VAPHARRSTPTLRATHSRRRRRRPIRMVRSSSPIVSRSVQIASRVAFYANVTHTVRRAGVLGFADRQRSLQQTGMGGFAAGAALQGLTLTPVADYRDARASVVSLAKSPGSRFFDAALVAHSRSRPDAPSAAGSTGGNAADSRPPAVALGPAEVMAEAAAEAMVAPTAQSPLLAQYAARRQAQLARVASLHSYQERQDREREREREQSRAGASGSKGTPPDKAAPQKSAGKGKS
jgi:hypothetical protein